MRIIVNSAMRIIDGLHTQPMHHKTHHTHMSVVNTMPSISMLLDALSQNGYACDSYTLSELIGMSSQDAQYSRAAAEHVAILNRFRWLENLTIREIKLRANVD